MAQILNERVTLAVQDGTTMAAYVARPAEGDRHPGMMVFQEAFGVNAHIREVADRFAREGFVTIAPELFHRTAPGFEESYDNFEATRPHTAALTEDSLEDDVRAAYDWLHADTRTDPAHTASIGFCMGGRVSFIANSILPVDAAISFYGGGIAPALLPRAFQLHAPMLMFWGGLDRHIGSDKIRDVVDALHAAGKEYVNVEFSHANHGFFCNARASYHKDAAQESWELVKSFLTTHIHSGRG